MAGFFLSGICAISAGILVSILLDLYHFSYGFSGTLISIMSIGNMLALLLSGILPAKLGERTTTLVLTAGYFLGYGLMALTGKPAESRRCSWQRSSLQVSPRAAPPTNAPSWWGRTQMTSPGP